MTNSKASRTESCRISTSLQGKGMVVRLQDKQVYNDLDGGHIESEGTCRPLLN